jgi:molybdopterin molybdotransferase
VISVEEAQRIIRENVAKASIIECKIQDALGLVLAAPILAKQPNPPFDASSVDGYAVSLKSFDALKSGEAIALRVAGEFEAGAHRPSRFIPKVTFRIFTGAQVPKGADAVVMQENVVRKNDLAYFTAMPQLGANIRPHGGEFQKRTKLFEEGTRINPAVLGALAGFGFAKVKVYARPHVAIVVTGNELRPPGTRLMPGQIWDANSSTLLAMLEALGFQSVKVFRARDTVKDVLRAFRKAQKIADVVVASGGVSVGDHDLVRPALEQLGVQQLFWRIRMKPGMPIYFGKTSGKIVRNRKCVFALPGNPVSALVTFQLFVREALLQMMGSTTIASRLDARLMQSITKSHARREYVRGLFDWRGGALYVTPLNLRESHMMSGIANANCLIEVPEETTLLEADSQVRIHPLQWTAY